jgi:hypothetical protein
VDSIIIDADRECFEGFEKFEVVCVVGVYGVLSLDLAGCIFRSQGRRNAARVRDLEIAPSSNEILLKQNAVLNNPQQD